MVIRTLKQIAYWLIHLLAIAIGAYGIPIAFSRFAELAASLI